MPKCGCTRKIQKHTKTGTRKQILHKWVKKGRQKVGFFPIIGAILAAISAGLSAAAPAVATGAIGAAAAYATTKALESIGGKTGAGRFVLKILYEREFVIAKLFVEDRIPKSKVVDFTCLINFN